MEKTEMCADGRKFRIDWLREKSKINKALYELHLSSCKQCRQHFAELTEAAQKAEHPEAQ